MAVKPIRVDYNFNGNKIQGIADGVLDGDAVNKGQLTSVQNSLTAYIDGEILGLGAFVGEIDPSSGLPTSGSGAAGAIDKGDWWYLNADGTILGVTVHKGDRLQTMVDNPDTTDNTAANTDFKVLHTYHEADSRYPLDNVSLVANTPYTVNHGLAYKFVHVSAAEADGKRIDLEVDYVDENNLTLTSNQNTTIWGVVSI